MPRKKDQQIEVAGVPQYVELVEQVAGVFFQIHGHFQVQLV